MIYFWFKPMWHIRKETLSVALRFETYLSEAMLEEEYHAGLLADLALSQAFLS